MKRCWQRVTRALAFAAVALVAAACDSLPGKPTPDERPVRPAEVKDFAALWGANCAGCHGADGTLGAGPPLASPVYLAIASDDAIRAAIAKGVQGTAMPAFAISEGGTLTDDQITAVVAGMRERWAKPQQLAGAALPAHGASSGGIATGDAARGAAAYATYCASCHGADGTGSARGGSVVDPSYLALVSDQGLRTTVIAGRPDLGMPDWRGYVAGRAMSEAEIADVVAWLAAKRSPTAGNAAIGGAPPPGPQASNR
jgi:mono/diheme cytochrome c family protein